MAFAGWNPGSGTQDHRGRRTAETLSVGPCDVVTPLCSPYLEGRPSAGGGTMEKKEPPRRSNSLSERTEIVESALDRAIKRGDFDDLPGMGKPLRGLHN
ncbi:DUF1992 domain-containing protein, partial [Mycobacterium tuberculosis]|nr:DUF1992 domain-containing protein [Mycobacterium tuberculosis]